MAQLQRINVGSAFVQAALDRYYGGGQAQILWVGNRSGLPAGNGTSPDYPMSALTGAGGALAALNGTTARGHVIFILPGSTFSVDAADWAVLTGNASSFAIVGLGSGVNRPIFTWTTATSSWLIDTADVAIDNVQMLWAGPHVNGTALTVAAPMTVSAAGFQLRNCFIRCGFDVDQIITVGCAFVAGGTESVVEKNKIIGLAAAKITTGGAVFRYTAADNAIFRNNYLSAAMNTNTDALLDTTTTLSLDMEILDNHFYANGSGNTCCMKLGAFVNTGRIQRNLMVVDADATAETVVLTRSATANMALLDNFLVNDNNERGLVIGTASV